MESDPIILEYLAQYGYDVERAWFNVCIEMGAGKGNALLKSYYLLLRLVILLVFEKVFGMHKLISSFVNRFLVISCVRIEASELGDFIPHLFFRHSKIGDNSRPEKKTGPKSFFSSLF